LFNGGGSKIDLIYPPDNYAGSIYMSRQKHVPGKWTRNYFKCWFSVR